MAAKGPLNFHAGPIVWIDCEMSGLNPKKDRLLEIAVLITDGNLKLVDKGIEFVIKTDRSILDNMDKWCTTQHGKVSVPSPHREYDTFMDIKSGLTQACLTSPYSRDYVSSAVLQYIKKWIPEQRTAVLAGNSVHADRSFLVEEMPEVIDWLHYR
ncbi:hypothetical protein ID866_3594 [Astraeus odoratus]|nr:hypothetical protein ID866_3594 [Astraeus odoratus]